MEAQPPVEQKPSRAQKIGHELWDWAKALLFAVAVVLLLTTFVFQIIRVDGTSMAETLHDGERMFVTKYQYLFGDPDRYDVVICNYPNRGRTNFVKRIVGIPGDTVAVRNGVLYVNGEAVEEDYIAYPPKYEQPETVVEEGHYFVMGDNRANSNDSRYVGQLTRDQIRGKVQAIVWPIDEWRRIE